MFCSVFFVVQDVRACGFVARGGGGKLIAISSIGEIFGMPQQEAYAASKGGLGALVGAGARAHPPPAIQGNPQQPGGVRTPPEKRNMAEVEENRRKAVTAFGILDAQLAKNEYVAGKSFSMGDIPAGVATYRWLHLPVERAPIPNVERWYRQIAERPVFKERCMLPLT